MRTILIALMTLCLASTVNAQCPNGQCPLGVNSGPRVVRQRTVIRSAPVVQQRVVSRSYSYGSTGTRSYGSVGSRSYGNSTGGRVVSRSQFTYRSSPRTTYYRQRWTVAGGNQNIVAHLSNYPHNFNVTGMTYDQMFELHDRHHDQIGPVSFVGNRVVFGAANTLGVIRSRVRSYAPVRRFFRVRPLQRFRMRLRGC